MIEVQPHGEIDNTVHFDFSFSYPPSPALSVTFSLLLHDIPARSGHVAPHRKTILGERASMETLPLTNFLTNNAATGGNNSKRGPVWSEALDPKSKQSAPLKPQKDTAETTHQTETQTHQ